VLTRSLIACIRLYQRMAHSRRPPRCVYQPSCSEYAVLAILRYGPVAGTLRAFSRVYRCRPGNGGEDWP